jgi:hypothetical protein
MQTAIRQFTTYSATTGWMLTYSIPTHPSSEMRRHKAGHCTHFNVILKLLSPETAERIGPKKRLGRRNHGKDDLASSRKVFPLAHRHF